MSTAMLWLDNKLIISSCIGQQALSLCFSFVMLFFKVYTHYWNKQSPKLDWCFTYWWAEIGCSNVSLFNGSVWTFNLPCVAVRTTDPTFKSFILRVFPIQTQSFPFCYWGSFLQSNHLTQIFCGQGSWTCVKWMLCSRLLRLKHTHSYVTGTGRDQFAKMSRQGLWRKFMESIRHSNKLRQHKKNVPVVFAGIDKEGNKYYQRDGWSIHDKKLWLRKSLYQIL